MRYVFFLSTTRSLSILPVTIAGHDNDKDDHGYQLMTTVTLSVMTDLYLIADNRFYQSIIDS